MSAAAPAIGSRDRLSVTFLFSLIFHGVPALGLTFAYEKPAPSLPSLDVILVQSASGQKPTQADFLAQANNSGGGDSEHALRPSALVSSPVNKPEPGVAPRPLRASAPRPSPPTEREMLTSRQADFSVRSEHETPDQPPLPQPTLPDMLQTKLEMAKLATETQRESQAYAKRPRIHRLNAASTMRDKGAWYKEEWRKKVERVGNLNYPDEARRQQIYGNLRMMVSINRDGSLYEVLVLESSGQPVLDQAAQRIVRLAAPFAPFTGDLAEFDRLEIIRTWRFARGDRLSSN